MDGRLGRGRIPDDVRERLASLDDARLDPDLDTEDDLDTDDLTEDEARELKVAITAITADVSAYNQSLVEAARRIGMSADAAGRRMHRALSELGTSV